MLSGLDKTLSFASRVNAQLIREVLHGSAPRYLGPLTRVADVPSRQNFRLAVTNRLIGQTVYCRQPGFSGCRFPHLELAP